jgi:hypothetical protein
MRLVDLRDRSGVRWALLGVGMILVSLVAATRSGAAIEVTGEAG